MLKTLTIVLGLALAAGCKTDAPETSAQQQKQEEIPSNAKPRSGKIDLNLPNKPQPSLPNAPDTADDDDGERERMSDEARAERRKQRLAQIDTDGDGVVSEAEREAMRAKREAAMKERFDANKDGVVSDEERANVRRQRAVDMHARFDKDGDGKLTQAELEASPMGRFNDSTAADANNDGTVTVDELDASMRERSGRGPWGRRGRMRGGSGEMPTE